uniref:Uncharacterized protein n=1 Tax=Poecilia reticulata TaxID=8081 RepID=A0A3P9NVS6_POERE
PLLKLVLKPIYFTWLSTPAGSSFKLYLYIAMSPGDSEHLQSLNTCLKRMHVPKLSAAELQLLSLDLKRNNLEQGSATRVSRATCGSLVLP